VVAAGGDDRRCGHRSNGANAAALWPLTVGAGVTVAVVDSGLDAGQPDLVGHLWQDPAPLPSGVDRNGVSFLPKLLSPPRVENVILPTLTMPSPNDPMWR